MNNEQRWLARFGAQPDGTGPFFRLPTLQLTCVRQVHGDRCASAVEKLAAVAATSIVLTGPSNANLRERILQPLAGLWFRYLQEIW